MLNFLSSGNQQKVVGVSLTPGIGLEAIELDSTYSTVLNYGRKRIEYNFSSREPQNYAQLKTALVELMDAMQIAPKTPIYFILPNVLFDFIDVPPVLTNEEIKTSILSETEKFYLFKKEEPYFCWNEIINVDGDEQKRLVYTAFQKNVVDQIKELVADIGLELIGIESSYSAILRGLRVLGQCEDVILEQAPWSVMVVNTNSYTIFQLEGKNLISYNEVPIAIKSYSTEEAYDSIVSSSSQLLSNRISSKLFIISQTDDISAELLKRHMEFDNTIVAINSNRHSNKPLMEIVQTSDFNLANSMTLEAIGSACLKREFGIIINVLNEDPNEMFGVYFVADFLGNQIEVIKNFITKVCILLVVLILLVLGGLSLAFFALDNSQKAKIDELNGQIQGVDQQISALSAQDNKQEIDITSIIDEIAQENVSTMSFYDSISTDIPKEVWLTKYYNKIGDKIAVQGIAQSIIDIYEYYKNLRIISPQSEIKLNELKVVTFQENEETPENKYFNSLNINKDKDRLYSFEISNVQVDFSKATTPNAKNQQGNDKNNAIDNLTNEIDIIKHVPIEQPSKQMVPAK